MACHVPGAAIPGFIYDESRQRYFRRPASHLASLPQYQRILQAPAATTTSLINYTPHHHRSAYSFFSNTRKREHAIPPQDIFHCYKMHCDSILYNLKKTSTTEIDLSSFGYQVTDYQLTDCAINSTGDLLAFSCAKEIQNVENPICCKYAYVVKIITNVDDREVQLKKMNDRLRVIKASSLQPGRGVNVISSDGCNKVILYSDILVEMAMLDQQDVQLIPLKQKDAISTVAVNPMESHYSLAVGFESGSIELFEENSNNSPLLRGKHSSVLSLAFSKQRPIIHAGHRNGCIAVWDFRTQKNVVSMWEKKIQGVSSSIIGIHPLLDDNYLICSAFNSKLSLWDLRQQKVVVAFNEQVNDYKYCQSVVDKAESFLISVGSDACIRIWILHTGELVRCIEPLEYGVRGILRHNTLPTICYSETLGGQQFNPSLLVGINNQIIQFSTHE